MTVRWLAIGGVALVVPLMDGCKDEPSASLQATVAIVEEGGTCASEFTPGASCTVARTLSITVQELGGRDVHLESVSAVLWDTRGMQDMHAVPASLGRGDIQQAVGASVLPAHGRAVIPYGLGFTVVRPFIMGPLEVRVHVRAREDGDSVVEADCVSF